MLDDNATVQLDDLVVMRQTLPAAREVAHYGIVVEQTGRIEGAELPSDTRAHREALTMPGRSAVTTGRGPVCCARCQSCGLPRARAA